MLRSVLTQLALMTVLSGVYVPVVELVQSSWTMRAPVVYDWYWALGSGRLGNYQGWYHRLGTTRHVYCLVDGNGADPGLAVAELAGSTGTAVNLTSGMTAPQAATAIAAGVAALPNWGATTSDGPDIDYSGPGVVAESAADWDDRGNAAVDTDERNGLLGMHTHRYDSGSGMVDGPLNGICTTQHMTVPAGDTRRIYALQIYIGAGWSATDAERAHWALYSGTSTTTPITGSTLLYDFGQELATFSSDGWHTLWVDADTLLEVDAGDELWLSCYGSGTTTTHGISNVSGAGHVGDWTNQGFVQSGSVMPTDATTAAPSAHAGTVSTVYAGTFMARFICEQPPFAGRGQLGSAADPLVIGHHTDFTDQTLDANAVLTQTVTMPAIGPSIPVALDMFVGDSHDATNQPLAYVYQGGSFASDPLQPTINGATLVRNFGRMTGTAVNQWVRTAGGVEVEVADQAVLTPGITHAGDARAETVTNISYIENAASSAANGDPITAPMEWIRPTAGSPNRGPELALIADGSSNFTVGDPSVAPPATIGTYTVPTTAAQFDNIGGIRLCVRCEGVLAA